MKSGSTTSYIFATIISFAVSTIVASLIFYVLSSIDLTDKGQVTVGGIIIMLVFFSVWKGVYSFLRKSDSKYAIKDKVLTEELLKTEEEFVLVLRPFTLDKQLDSYTVSNYDTFIGIGTEFLTLEEQITDAFTSNNLKVIGIADNTKKEIYIGYERYAADNADWKQKVTTLILKAKYICFLGFGDGEFNWEIDEVFDQFCLRKTILFFPSDTRKATGFNKAYSRFGFQLETKDIELNNENVFGGVLYYDKKIKRFSQYNFTCIKKNKEILLNTETFLMYYLNNLPLPQPKNKKLFGLFSFM